MKTIKRTITLRRDVYEKLQSFRKSSDFENFFLLRESTLITLILEWAFAQKSLTHDKIIELYTKGVYDRVPSMPWQYVRVGDHYERRDWKELMKDKKK